MAASALALLNFALCLSSAAAIRIYSGTASCPAVKSVAKPKWLPLTYNFTQLPGSVEAINNAGTIAEGNWITSPPYSKYSTVKYPKASSTNVYGLNSKGFVVGSITLTSAPSYSYGFVSNGSYGNSAGYKMYAHPNATKPTQTSTAGTTFTAINDNNIVVGNYIDSKGVNQGFSFSLATGVWTTLKSAYSVSVFPTSINSLGVITGYVLCSNGYAYGFLHSKGAFTYFSLFASYETYPHGINSKGYIVGTYQPLMDNFAVAFVAVNVTTSPSVFTFAITTAAPGTTVPKGINDWGTIVGVSYGVSDGFVGVQK